MRCLLIVFILVAVSYQVTAQEQPEIPKSYIGLAYGTSFPIGDFGSSDISNPDAGLAKKGQRIDVYGGYYLGKKDRITLTGVFRSQTFETKIEDLIAALKIDEPNLELTGSTNDWRVYSLLAGLAYKVDIGSRFTLFPRFGIGPIWVTTPGVAITAPNAVITQKFIRSSENDLGLGYELGLGFRKDLGRHFALIPTFTFSGGFASVKDVVTTTDNIIAIGNYHTDIQSFNIGLSMAYRIY